MALTTFVGGARQPELVASSDEHVTDRVLSDLESLMDLQGDPSLVVIKRWQRAIPQYNLGHLDVMAAVDAFEQRFPGLYFCSNFRGGIAIGDCIFNAKNTVERVEEFLSQKVSAEIGLSQSA